MDTITFNIDTDTESGWLIASWDDPKGGVTTQAKKLRDLEANIREAVTCHFEEGRCPSNVKLHFLQDVTARVG